MALPLYEQARPMTLDDVAGQDKAVSTIRRFMNREPMTPEGFYPGIASKVFWITGISGVGKTTLSRIIARSVSLPYAIQEMDAADLSIDRVREIEKSCRFKPIGCLGHAYIINEAHSLRGPMLAKLNTTLEDPYVQSNSTWAFTTTIAGQQKLFSEDEIETVPFGSRTIPIRLESNNVIAFAERIRKVAQAANLDGKPLGDYIALVKKHNLNLRECLQAVDAGAMQD